MKRSERIVRRMADKMPTYVGVHSADWFERLLTNPAPSEPDVEEYTWIQEKCGDAFCNQASGHGYGPYGTRCDNEMFPLPHWKRERVGFRAKQVPSDTGGES